MLSSHELLSEDAWHLIIDFLKPKNVLALKRTNIFFNDLVSNFIFTSKNFIPYQKKLLQRWRINEEEMLVSDKILLSILRSPHYDILDRLNVLLILAKNKKVRFKAILEHLHECASYSRKKLQTQVTASWPKLNETQVNVLFKMLTQNIDDDNNTDIILLILNHYHFLLLSEGEINEFLKIINMQLMMNKPVDVKMQLMEVIAKLEFKTMAQQNIILDIANFFVKSGIYSLRKSALKIMIKIYPAATADTRKSILQQAAYLFEWAVYSDMKINKLFSMLNSAEQKILFDFLRILYKKEKLSPIIFSNMLFYYHFFDIALKESYLIQVIEEYKKNLSYTTFTGDSLELLKIIKSKLSNRQLEELISLSFKNLTLFMESETGTKTLIELSSVLTEKQNEIILNKLINLNLNKNNIFLRAHCIEIIHALSHHLSPKQLPDLLNVLIASLDKAAWNMIVTIHQIMVTIFSKLDEIDGDKIFDIIKNNLFISADIEIRQSARKSMMALIPKLNNSQIKTLADCQDEEILSYLIVTERIDYQDQDQDQDQDKDNSLLTLFSSLYKEIRSNYYQDQHRFFSAKKAIIEEQAVSSRLINNEFLPEETFFPQRKC